MLRLVRLVSSLSALLVLVIRRLRLAPFFGVAPYKNRLD